MLDKIKGIFLDHPKEVGETYLEHMMAAIGWGISIWLISIAIFIHALIPALFKRTASTKLEMILDSIEKRRRI